MFRINYAVLLVCLINPLASVADSVVTSPSVATGTDLSGGTAPVYTYADKEGMSATCNAEAVTYMHGGTAGVEEVYHMYTVTGYVSGGKPRISVTRTHTYGGYSYRPYYAPLHGNYIGPLFDIQSEFITVVGDSGYDMGGLRITLKPDELFVEGNYDHKGVSVDHYVGYLTLCSKKLQ